MPSHVPLSTTARRAGESPISDLMARALAAPDLISLAAGFVDHATLPHQLTAAALGPMLNDPVEGRRALQYGTTRGDLHLRQRLVAKLEREEGADPGAFEDLHHRVVVTNGSQQLLYLVAEALLDPGDIVLVESPTYFVYLGLLEARGARAIGVATDEEGLRVDDLDATLARLEASGELNRVKLVYTVSEHGNPTGLSLAAERRKALVATVKSWSKAQRIFVLEDAAYRGLTFDGNEPASVWSHDQEADTVILARTFSKTFSPGLKTGYGVLPNALVGPILNLKSSHDFGSNHFAQQLLERVLAEGHDRTQADVLATTYRRKRDVLLHALDRELGPYGLDVSWTRPRGGLYVWLTLPEDVDTGRDGPFFARCLEEGVLYVPGSYAFPPEPRAPASHHARLTFGVTAEPGLEEGVRRLASALAKTRRHGTSRPGRRPVLST